MLTSSALNTVHVFQTGLANSVAVIDAVATISVQLLFKGGQYSAYTCTDYLIYCTHFHCHKVCSYAA